MAVFFAGPKKGGERPALQGLANRATKEYGPSLTRADDQHPGAADGQPSKEANFISEATRDPPRDSQK